MEELEEEDSLEELDSEEEEEEDSEDEDEEDSLEEDSSEELSLELDSDEELVSEEDSADDSEEGSADDSEELLALDSSWEEELLDSLSLELEDEEKELLDSLEEDSKEELDWLVWLEEGCEGVFFTALEIAKPIPTASPVPAATERATKRGNNHTGFFFLPLAFDGGKQKYSSSALTPNNLASERNCSTFGKEAPCSKRMIEVVAAPMLFPTSAWVRFPFLRSFLRLAPKAFASKLLSSQRELSFLATSVKRPSRSIW